MNLSPDRTQLIENRMQKANKYMFDGVFKHLRTDSEQFYVLTSMTQDYTKITMEKLLKAVPSQEAKASMKIILDTILFDYGMSVKIDEFEPS